MSWLARSIANSLKLDDGDTETGDVDERTSPDSKSLTKDEADQHSPSSTTSATTPRGVKEDLSELTKTLSRQFWGVASFLAPPPEPLSPPSRQISGEHSDPQEADALIEGIRSDFAEIGGKFKSGISKLSGNVAVSEITKIASNFLQFGSETDDVDLIGGVIGVTEEVVAFARDISMHPETWMDFPVPDTDDFDDFDMSDAQQEHALAVERLAPRLAALRIELCPGYMSEGCFWKIYFVLLHPRLTKHDAELLSTPQIMEARSMLSHELQNRAKAELIYSGVDISRSEETASLPQEDSPFVRSHSESDPAPLVTLKVKDVPPSVGAKTIGNDAVSTSFASDLETEKHPIQSTEVQIVDKVVVEEESLNQAKHQASSSSSLSRVLDDKFEDDGDDWLKEENSEMVGTSRTIMPLENDEDVSFSDLEEDDGDIPIIYKKVTSGSDISTKDSRDWVELSRSSADSVKDISADSIKRAGSERVNARNTETKESNDWVDFDAVDAM